MAALQFIPRHNNYRVRYWLGIDKKEIDKSFKRKPDAKAFKSAITPVEASSKLGQARDEDIARWVTLKYLTQDLARHIFKGAGVIIETATDYDTLEDKFDKFLSRHPRSYKNSKSRANRIFEWLRKNVSDLREMEADEALEYFYDLTSDGTSQKTVYHYATVLRQLLDVAVGEKMMRHNVARDADWKQPKAADSPRRPVDDIEKEAILSTVEQPKYAAYLGGSMEIAIWLGKDLGLRNREAEMVLWTDINWDKKLVVIPKQKTLPDGSIYEPKTWGTVPMTNELTERLRVWQGRSDHDFVLGGRRTDLGVCKPWKKEAIMKAFQKLTKAAKLKGITFYCFRHRFCRLCLTPKDQGGAGHDVYRVMKLMRHANLSTTQLYLADLSDETNDMEGMQF